MDIFNKNLQALQQVNPNLANKLKSTINTNYEIYQGDDPANINYINKKVFKPIYDNPIKETMQKIKEFEKYREYPVLYFFGLGNGIFYKSILAHKKLEKVIIYEADIEIIYITLNLLDLSEEIASQRLQIIYAPTYDNLQAKSLFGDWNYKFFLKLYDLIIHSPFYSTTYQNEIIRINNINTSTIKAEILSHGNDAKDSLIGIKQGYHHIPEMVKNYKVRDLFNTKPSKVAVIVSTGPSLNKQLDTLKKVAPYVTIISVDASLPILEKAGIKPDFVCVLERVELTSQFFVNTSDEFMKDIYFITASLVHDKTLQEIKGKKVITMRPFTYNRYLELDKFGYLGVGMSAANMAFELAYNMGFSTTILIGQDLAYGDDVSHADGHVLGADEVVKRKTNDFYVEAYGGKGEVKTYKFWNIFRLTFEQQIDESKDKMLTINSTEGGARIHGALEIPFKEAIKNLNIPKEKITLQKPSLEESKTYLKQAIDKIDSALEYSINQKKKFEDLFLKVAQVSDELIELNKNNQLEKIDFEKLNDLSDEIDNVKEIINEELFQKLFIDILQPILVSAELELAKVIVQPVNNEMEKKAKIIDWVMKHKNWLFLVAGSVDTQIYVMKEELEYLKKEYEKLN